MCKLTFTYTGPQALLSLARLSVCQVYSHSRTPARDGGPGGAATTTGTGRERSQGHGCVVRARWSSAD